MKPNKPIKSWIWWDGEASPRNAHLCFRKVFSLPKKPARALVRLSADSRYQLWVNGKFVCRGPARYYPNHVCVDEVDLAPFLRKKRNVIEAHVHHFGEDTYDYLHTGQGGFVLEGGFLHTDETWQAAELPGWQSDTCRLNTRQGFQEWYDARQADRLEWKPAKRLSPSDIKWSGEEARDVPFLIERFQPFKHMHSAWRVRSPRNGDSPRNLADEIRRLEFLSRLSLPKQKNESVTIPRDLALIFELPAQKTGHPQIEVEGAQGGEEFLWSYGELLHWNRWHQHGHAETTFADLFTAAQGRSAWQTYFPRAFRYVLLVARNIKRPVRLRVGYTETTYPLTREAGFQCNDERLNRIWQVSLDTLANTMAADAYIDSFRERAQWWGTGVMAAIRFNAHTGADLSLARRGLRQAAQSQREDGQLMANFPNRVLVPAETGEQIGLVLPDYSLQWILTLWDYYWYSGDEQPLHDHWPVLQKLLAWDEPRITSNSLLKAFEDYWVFIDWKTSRRLNQRCQSASVNLFYVLALEKAAAIGRRLGRASEASGYQALADRIKQAVMTHHFEPRDGFLYEYLSEGRRVERLTLHANVLGLLANLPGLDQAALSKKLFEGLVGYGYWDGPDDADIGFYLFVFDAMMKTGWGDKAVELACHRWGALLDLGLANWPEFWHYDLHVRAGGAMSVAWGVSPCLVFIEHVLGLRPTAPGFREISWCPHPGSLARLNAVIPTPFGPLRFDGKRKGTDFLWSTKFPPGVRVRLGHNSQ